MPCCGSACKNIPNVEIDSFNGLTVSFAKQKGATVMVRGLRAVTDFENEIQLAHTNFAMMPEIETVFLATAIKWSYLSSTIVREAAHYGQDVSRFVPRNVEQCAHRQARGRGAVKPHSSRTFSVGLKINCYSIVHPKREFLGGYL